MKKLDVPFLHLSGRHAPASDLLAALTPLAAHEIDITPWAAFPYRPSVQFRIAHTVDSILLVYDVSEKHVQCKYHNTNDPVYKDSCVEFFLSFDGTYYYNLEFNRLGTGLIGYGNAARSERRRLPDATIEKVKCYSYAGESKSHDDTAWRLMLVIPFTVFEAHHIESLTGMRCKGNFYKCGDDLPIPHYLVWNEIDHPEPNFHLPSYFGELNFQ